MGACHQVGQHQAEAGLAFVVLRCQRRAQQRQGLGADLRAAYDEPDTDKSIAAWRKVLGDKFNPPNTKRTGASTNPYIASGSAASVAASSRSGRSG